MKLRNKKTGEIGTVKVEYQKFYVTTHRIYPYNTLAELFEEWEDYEEPKELKIHWYIYGSEPLEVDEQNWNKEFIEELKSVGNYFETKEEAEKAVLKLKAWKRLKDKGFEFINFPYKKICKYDARTGVGNLEYQVKYYEELDDDLDLLFGGGDE